MTPRGHWLRGFVMEVLMTSSDWSAFFDRFPPRVLITTAPCPVCHKKSWVDLVRGDGTCRRGHHQSVAAFLTGVPDPTPLDWPCPRCQRALQPTDETVSCVCGWEGTRTDLEDRVSQQMMEEAPNGATIYHKPRHGRRR